MDPVDELKPNTFTDEAANFDPNLTDLVEQGKVIPYRNYAEDVNSTSYRGKPESLETWGEHVLATEAEHVDVNYINKTTPRRGRAEPRSGLCSLTTVEGTGRSGQGRVQPGHPAAAE